VLTLYQAEWCPYSSAVREVLTELGLDFVARQVEPEPEQRATLLGLSGKSSIPVLETEDGELFRGAREIFRYLETREGWEYADEHRRQWIAHADARKSDAASRILKRFRVDRPGPPVTAGPDEAEVVNVPDESRYELRLGDRRLGYARTTATTTPSRSPTRRSTPFARGAASAPASCAGRSRMRARTASGSCRSARSWPRSCAGTPSTSRARFRSPHA
jgi:glutathione S-transferase